MAPLPRKQVRSVPMPQPPHWVGDGFHVRSVFSYDGLGRELSPFLLLDHGAPHRFEPTTGRRGVGPHPHRGFETVTIAYQGEVEHRDSSGGGGVIGPGDVQWMTAGGGIVHEEFHSKRFSRSGGTMEMVQLWVNLPKVSKRAPARYQAIEKSRIPAAELPDGAGSVRVIAGAFQDARGPAETFTPIELWTVELRAGRELDLPLRERFTAALLVLDGELRLDDARSARSGSLVVLSRDGEGFPLRAAADARVLVMSGEPIDEPIVGYGPFVMNTQAEIHEAVEDFQSGRMGRLTARA